MPERRLLQRVCDGYRRILGEKLTGIYLHGSIAMGCFTWATGDIDFLAVTEAPLTQEEKEAIIRLLMELSPDAPPKGFEMSVVLRSVCRPFRYPTPFELHYSNSHRARAEAELSAYCRDMHGTDPDLAAHITVLKKRGETLFGPEIGTVFADVPPADYADSILQDVCGALEDIALSPVYVTLNLCRVLACLQGGAVLSKQEGGQWGLLHLPEKYHPLLRGALAAYGGAAFPDGLPLQDFAQEMLRRIHALDDAVKTINYRRPLP